MIEQYYNLNDELVRIREIAWQAPYYLQGSTGIHWLYLVEKYVEFSLVLGPMHDLKGLCTEETDGKKILAF